MLRNTAEAADSSPRIPAVLRQCFTNWLFRNLGAFQESSSATFLLPIREGLPSLGKYYERVNGFRFPEAELR
jgi:hypothetical protein